jgi:phosphoglycolate phosphatase-like HAD superfamily hydrolase
MARAVLFDIDGTLIRTGGAGVKAFARASETAFGIPNGTAHMKFAGRTDRGLVREFLEFHRLETSAENINHFLDAYVFWIDQLLPQCSGGVCPGVWKFIADLRALDEPPLIGLLTGNIRLGAEIKLRHYGLWQEFATGGFADDHEDRNQIAVAAHRRVGRHLKKDLRGEEIIVVGDTPHDIRCGRAIGARVIAVATGGSAFDEIKQHAPDWCVKDLREVTAREVCS